MGCPVSLPGMPNPDDKMPEVTAFMEERLKTYARALAIGYGSALFKQSLGLLESGAPDTYEDGKLLSPDGTDAFCSGVADVKTEGASGKKFIVITGWRERYHLAIFPDEAAYQSKEYKKAEVRIPLWPTGWVEKDGKEIKIKPWYKRTIGDKRKVTLKFPSDDETSTWYNALWYAKYKAGRGDLPSVEKPVIRAAIRQAYIATWWSAPGWWGPPDGWLYSPEEYLSEHIADGVEATITRPWLAELNAPSVANEVCFKAFYKVISAGVDAATPKAIDALSAASAPLEKIVAEKSAPLKEAREKIIAEIRKGISGPVGTAVQGSVGKVLKPIVDVLVDMLAPIFIEVVKNFKTKYGGLPLADANAAWGKGHGYWAVWAGTHEARSKIWKLIEDKKLPLAIIETVATELGGEFSTMSIAYLIGEMVDTLFMNMLFTLSQKPASTVLVDAAHDAGQAAYHVVVTTINQALTIPLATKAGEELKKVLEPLDSMIPDPLNQILSLPDIGAGVLEEIITGVMSDLIKAAAHDRLAKKVAKEVAEAIQ